MAQCDYRASGTKRNLVSVSGEKSKVRERIKYLSDVPKLRVIGGHITGHSAPKPSSSASLVTTAWSFIVGAGPPGTLRAAV